MTGVAWLKRLVVLAVLAATLPSPGSLGQEHVSLGIPLDSSLRVPLAAVLLGSGAGELGFEDRLLGFSSVPSGGWRTPRRRSDLLHWLGDYEGDQLDVLVASHEGTERVRLAVERSTVAQRMGRDVPTFLAGFLLLALALALPAGPAHPAVPPLFAVCCAAGGLLLSLLDGIVPEAPALLPVPDVRARVGALAFVLLPATLTHLAARFPGPASRFPGTAVLPYLGWGLAAAFAQVHLADAALRNSLDRIAAGAGVGAMALVLLGVLSSARGLRPIERARAGALVAALAAAASLVAGGVLLTSAPPRGLAGPLLLAIVAFPLSIAAALVYYGLATPPAWISWLSSALQPVARRRYDRERASRVTLDVLANAVAEAPDARRVGRALLDAVAHLLRPEACLTVDPSSGEALSSPLARDGLLLWRAAGEPRMAVRVSSRRLDPCVDRAELVVPVLPRCGRRVLVVLSGRSDGLPWARDHEAILQSFVPVAATALDAVAKRSELTERVLEKTCTLERAVADRGRLLTAAREMGEADDCGEVRAVLDRLGGLGGAGPDREGELRPQLETAAVFAEIALARLQLLEDLKVEVDRQAAELTESRSRRLHAEFVRGVAHELRKPLDELARRVRSARKWAPVRSREDLEAAVSAGNELARRLDLLLCHSGLRLDRRRIDVLALARAALVSARDAARDRSFVLECGWPRVPMIGDPGRIGSVLENLLDNAVKATESGQEIRLRVGLEPMPGAARSVFFEVVDGGCGIPAARIDAVFSPGVSWIPGGFGLGLTLCRQIVRMHGGTLDVESRTGCTTFRAVLPQLGRSEVQISDEEDAEHAA